MLAYFVTGVIGFLAYLYLTVGSGTLLGAWSGAEVAAGVITGALAGAAGGKLLYALAGARMLNPRRWLLFLVYLFGPFFWGMAKANLDVAGRVITGRIRPGIVKIEPGLASDLALTLLANSITLTPGTLTVEADDEGALYIHWIYVREENPTVEEVCGSFAAWARRIAE
ncbi:MAG: Na+/H+ antiporter subunit E [Moorellales bacterium]